MERVTVTHLQAQLPPPDQVPLAMAVRGAVCFPGSCGALQKHFVLSLRKRLWQGESWPTCRHLFLFSSPAAALRLTDSGSDLEVEAPCVRQLPPAQPWLGSLMKLKLEVEKHSKHLYTESGRS